MAGGACKLLLSIAKDNRAIFMQYILTVIVRVLFLGYLGYSAMLAVHFGFDHILLMFIIFIILTFVELYRRYVSYMGYISCQKILFIDGYQRIFKRLLRVEPMKLIVYNSTSLPDIVNRASVVSFNYFDSIDLGIQFYGSVILFSAVAVIERFSNIIFIIAGFGSAYLILQTPITTEITTECLEDSSHSMSLLWDSAIHGEHHRVEDRIISNIAASEKEKMSLSAEQDRILLKAYLVLMIFMFIMLYRTVNFNSLASVVLHVYSLGDIADMLGRYIELRDKVRATLVDEKILETITDMPLRPYATQIKLIGDWRLLISDTYMTTPPLEQNKPIEFHSTSHVLIDGASGAGKSTLLGIFSALLTPQRLRVRLNDTDIVSMQTGDSELTPQQAFQMLRSQICYMYQEVTMPIGNVASAIDNIHSVLRDEVLELLEISHISNNDCSTLTTTQQCLVLIGANLYRTLVQKHPIIIMDEVEKSLDDRHATRIMSRLIDTLKDRCILVVTHSEQVKRIFNEKIMVDNGKF
jgi:putative ABC transport system ATP-binding protein